MLEESDKEENLDSDSTPPDKEAELAASAAKVTAKERERQSFWHLDIENHEKKLRDEAYICPCDWAEVGICTPAMELPPL